MQTIPANELLAGLTLAEPAAIHAVVTDSRKVEPGCVFVCFPGERVDGHAFAAGAYRNGAAYIIANRPVEEVARSTDFYFQPDVYLVSGLTAGCEADSQIISRVKKATTTPVFANNGVRLENVDRQLAVADGCIIGTTFKKDGQFSNEVDEARVAQFMKRVREIRGEA